MAVERVVYWPGRTLSMMEYEDWKPVTVEQYYKILKNIRVDNPRMGCKITGLSVPCENDSPLDSLLGPGLL